MRLSERDKRPVTIRQPVDDEDQYRWMGSEVIRTVVQPANSQTLAAIYGERAQRMLLMLYAGPFQLEERQGVCVCVPPDAPCDYRIVSA